MSSVFYDRPQVRSAIQLLTNFKIYVHKFKKTKDEFVLLGSAIGKSCRKELLNEKLGELKKC